jgi:tetratricopeptide (TPR) repeat protein
MDDNTPKVVDFGLAKSLEAGSDLTQSGVFVGTPSYAAPEQVEGPTKQVGPAADIYALGAIFYQMLTGRPPFQAATVLQMLEQVKTADPVPPSRLQPGLPRDAETIALKCLQKDPQRRYPSADELGEDLRRFIAGEPVQARRISAAERLVRWAVRNPVVAGLAAAVFLAMAVGTAVSTWQMIRARTAVAAEKQAHAAAQAREAEARAVLEFVEERIFAAARPAGQARGLGREVTLRQAIGAALPSVAEGFTSQPLIEARLRRTLGTSYLYLGEARTAAEQFEASLALYARHRGPDDPETLTSMHSLASSYSALGRLAEAIALREETLALRKARLGPDHLDTLKSMNNLANSYDALGRHIEALKLHEETLALRQAKLGPDHPTTLRSMHNLANSYDALGRHAEALVLREEMLALQKAKLGPDHPDTLMGMNGLAYSYNALGRHDEALKLNQETLRLRQAKLGPDHPDTLMSMSNVANSYDALGQHAEALKLNQETLRLRQAKLGPDHPDTLVSMSNLACSYDALGRHTEALKLNEETLRLRQAKLGPDHPDTLTSHLGVASRLVRLGRGAEAAADCRRAAETWEKLGVPDADSLYYAACFRAVTGAALRAADESPVGAKHVEAEADRAMAWLKRAVAAGYRNAARMAEDRDLDVLRHRADFKGLLAQLSAAQPK